MYVCMFQILKIKSAVKRITLKGCISMSKQENVLRYCASFYTIVKAMISFNFEVVQKGLKQTNVKIKTVIKIITLNNYICMCEQE
jgi:hypothetical protein